MTFPKHSDSKRLPGAVLLVLFVVAAAYSKHFQNAFHFDDLHTISGNVYIQDLKNVPRFFTDARLFSTLPSHQVYEPVTSATLAIDYWLAGGLKPLCFHLSTFVWFLVMLVLLFFLFRRIMDIADAHPTNSYFALLAMACFGLHPAIAETVNYIIQRADVYSTLGVVAALVMYMQFPGLRKRGWYMVPAMIGMLAKAPALIFPLILVVYVFLFETGGGLSRRNWAAALKATVPAFVAGIAMAAFIWKMTPSHFEPGAASPMFYWITQPFVALHYFKSFFLLTELSADTDWTVVAGVFSTESVIGFAFLAIMLVLAVRTSRHPETRPIAFGILWFFLALMPTAVTPLAEVTNDHRMFFPFIGLALAAVWTLRLLLFRQTARLTTRPGLVRLSMTAAALILAISASGTWQRNRVWRTEESLWLDVTQKSPKNGRGLMNYGLSRMSKGDYALALQYFERALVYSPNYSLLEINLGIVNGGLGRDSEAERHFLRALSLAPSDADPHYFYARWLRLKGRSSESIAQLEAAVRVNPDSFDARRLLMQAYADRFIALSLLYYQEHKYPECIQAARQALELSPNDARAYNNMGAAFNSMALWDQGIRAEQEALRIEPDFELAKNNLLYAIAQKRRETGGVQAPLRQTSTLK